MSIVVAGGSLAGLRAAETLISLGVPDEITVVSAEVHPPYNRPPLSKTALTAAVLPTAGYPLRSRYEHHQQLRWRRGQSVVSADLAAHLVELDTDEIVRWRGLVAATGLRPRRLSLPGPSAGRHAIRTLQDARQLREQAANARHAVIIGAGILGCEIAMTLTHLGLKVTVVDPFGPPLQRVLGVTVAADLQQRMQDRGIEFLIGSAPVMFLGSDAVSGVRLDDGTDLTAQVAVECIGSTPNVEWLANNGLDLTDGVLCADDLSVTGTHQVVACGDIARFPYPVGPGPRRVEHWTMAVETARRAATTLAAQLTTTAVDARPFAPVPYFWSVLGDIDVHCVGVPSTADRTVVLDGQTGRDVTYAHLSGHTIVAVSTVGTHRAQTHAACLGTTLTTSA